jgi:hypothetical protein
MIIKPKTQSRMRNREITLAFQKYSKVIENLFDGGENGLDKIKDSESLEEMLYDGQFLYWDLKLDEFDSIIAVKPYPVSKVIQNLYSMRVKELKDTFADFESRL